MLAAQDKKFTNEIEELKLQYEKIREIDLANEATLRKKLDETLKDNARIATEHANLVKEWEEFNETIGGIQ